MVIVRQLGDVGGGKLAEIRAKPGLLALRSPLSIVLHLVLLAAMVYHAVSWFEIMPKTMPMLFVGGKRVEASTITRAGFVAAVLAAAALFAVAWMLRP